MVYIDQGTQFVFQEFTQFAVQYRLEVQHSGPRYPQSNGFVEAMVKVVKGIMEKAEDSGSDPHLAMLIYCATPIRPGQLSPGEMLSQQKCRALLPIYQYLHQAILGQAAQSHSYMLWLRSSTNNNNK